VTVDVAVRAAQANSLSSSALALQLADECTRRAVICSEYATAMDEYERRSAAHRTAMASYLEQIEAAAAAGHAPNVGSPPWPPTEPQRPHAWVER
jgi:hypothetical protein